MLRLTKLPIFLLSIFCIGLGLTYAQEIVIRESRAIAVPSSSVSVTEEKGSTVRGRVFYQDTGKPVRHGFIGLSKIKELVEQPKDNDSKQGVGTGIVAVSSSPGADRYVLTDENGEFELKNIKAGIYQAIVKVPGVLNPSYSDRENPEFQQFAIDGVSDAQTEIRVRRGAAISGVISYPDGEPIIGAKVQITPKDSGIFRANSYGESLNLETTDDRGFYRFSGLPAGEYIVRVTEQTNHGVSGQGIQSYGLNNFQTGSELKTYYGNVSDIDEANSVQIYLGQEQTGIDIVVPNRQLFRISGSVVAKNTNQPLSNIEVSFVKLEEKRPDYGYSQGNRTEVDKQGNWAFKEMPKGKYYLRFSPKTDYSSRNQKTENENQPKYATVNRQIEIDLENLTDIKVELPTEASISGIVTVEGNKPFPNFVSFSAQDDEKKIFASGYVSNYGNNDKSKNNSSREFRIGNLYEGSFKLSARTQEYYVKSIRLGNRDLMNSPIDVKDGDNIEGLQVILGTDVGTLKGNVGNMTKNIRAFVIMLQPEKDINQTLRNSNSGLVYANGDFEIKAAPGEYLVLVGTDFNRPKSDNLNEWYNELIKNAQKVTLRANETTTINLSLPN